MRQWHDRRRPLIVAALLVALSLTTAVGGPLVGTVTSAPADQPPATASPVTAPGLVRLRASHTDVPAGHVEERADQAASRTYAADLYQCDARGTCLLRQEADPSAEVRVVWRR